MNSKSNLYVPAVIFIGAALTVQSLVKLALLI